MFVLGSIGTHAIGYSMHKKPPYHPANDFQPVSLVADAPLMLMAQEGPAAEQPQGVHHLHQGQPGQDAVRSGGTGTSSHIGCVMLNQVIGVNVTHVPYRGGGPALQDLMAGRIDYICNYISIRAARAQGGPGQGDRDARARAHAVVARGRRPPTSRA